MAFTYDGMKDWLPLRGLIPATDYFQDPQSFSQLLRLLANDASPLEPCFGAVEELEHAELNI